MKGKLIARGLSAKPGTVIAIVRIVNGDETKMAQVQPGEALVGNKFLPVHDTHLSKAVALLENTGGLTRHAALYVIDKPILSIGGTMGDEDMPTNLLTVLKQGQKVVIDGEIGKDEKGRRVGGIYEWVPGAEEVPKVQPVKPPAVISASLAAKAAELAKKYRVG